MGFSGAGIKGCSISNCSSKCCPISAVSPHQTTNVVSGGDKQCIQVVKGSIGVTDGMEGEQRGDDNDRLVAKCSVPVCPPPGVVDDVEIMCGTCDSDEGMVPRSVPEASPPH